MKTDELIAMLATGAVAVEPRVVERRYATGLGIGGLIAVLLMAGLLGVRADLAAAAHLPTFMVKLGFAASLALASLVATLRLSRPGMRLGLVSAAIAAPVLLLWVLGAIELLDAAPAHRSELLMGRTWAVCPFLIALLSLPLGAGALWAMRGLAPTRLRLAGAAAGLLAGALAALVYALHCPESAAPFIGCWYVLGVAIPAALGALLGPRLLRW